MRRHLTEKELIEYQFELASEKQAQEISSHLEGCADCRQLAEQLKHKFITLDLLREDAEVSDKLIFETIAQAKGGTKSTILLFRKPAWIGAAAAVLPPAQCRRCATRLWCSGAWPSRSQCGSL